MNSSPRSNDSITLLTDRLRATWGTVRRWTPGEATWAMATDSQAHRVETLGTGVCWLRPRDVVIVATTIEEANDGLRLARRSPVQISAADETLRSAADRRGWRPDGPLRRTELTGRHQRPAWLLDQAGLTSCSSFADEQRLVPW